jgi:hypothetical protein
MNVLNLNAPKKYQLNPVFTKDNWITGPKVINIYGHKSIVYISVDYLVIRNFLFTRQLGGVNHGKKSVVDNIGPWTLEVTYVNPLKLLHININ